MKRLLVIAVLTAALVLGFASVAMANYGPHGGYLADTDACAGCHRAHTAISSITWNDSGGDPHNALLVSTATTMMDFCYACHGNNAPGAATNVQGGVLDTAILGDSQAGVGEVNKVLNGGGFSTLGFGTVDQKVATSQHDVDGSGTWYTAGSTIWGSWGPGTANGPGARLDLNCTNCHDPHGSSNYRILNDSVQGRKVGGYTPSAGHTFKDDVDPEPDPWVLSNEIGYPATWNGYTYNGFRLHKSYWHYDGPITAGDYMPDYTNACYAEPVEGLGAGTHNTTGMSGWCTRACHDQYMVKVGTLDNDAGPGVDGTNFGTLNAAGAYDAGDDAGSMVRHRHPINVPLNVFDGDRVLIPNQDVWQAWDPAVKYVDLPLLHTPGNGENQGNRHNSANTGPDANYQEDTLDDGIDCLTCHRAHGTDAVMTGYANSDSNVNPSRDSGIMGTQPTNDSALLRADNRGVCERCHNK